MKERLFWRACCSTFRSWRIGRYLWEILSQHTFKANERSGWMSGYVGLMLRTTQAVLTRNGKQRFTNQRYGKGEE